MDKHMNKLTSALIEAASGHTEGQPTTVDLGSLAKTAEDLWTRLGPFSTREVLGGTGSSAYAGNMRKIAAELERLGFTRRDIPASYGAMRPGDTVATVAKTVAVWFKR